MSSFLSMTALGGSAWLSIIAGATAAGEFELACKIFLYGGLAGWAVVMLIAPRQAQAEAHSLRSQRHSVPGLTERPADQPEFLKLLGLTALSTALFGGFAGMLIAGNVIAASVIPLSALAGGAVIYFGARTR